MRSLSDYRAVALSIRCQAGTLLMVLFAAPTAATPMPATPGEGFEVERYEVSLRPDLASMAVSGRETIRFKSTVDGLDRLVFSPNALQIEKATLDGQPLPIDKTANGIAFALPRTLSKGETSRLAFEMHGVPARGLVRLGNGLYTSYFACDWMVCLQDLPGDKAQFSLDLYLPAGMSSLGVGRALPTQSASDDRVLHRWRSTRPYSAYLFGFAAGRFTQATARSPVGNLVYLDGTGEARDLREAFARSPAIARFLADKAGIDLPERLYTQLLVPKREAQEAATFALIGEEELDREHQQPDYAWIIAHEMAHQWWGNLVTCASWQDFWLNEGIATFMVAAWKEHTFGPAAYRAELNGARQRWQRAQAAGFDKPLAWPGTYPSLGIRRAIQYSKGVVFLDHLRTMIGEDAFWDGIRTFTRRHAGKTVTSHDLQVSMENASGRDLRAVFAEWVLAEPSVETSPQVPAPTG